MVLGVGWPTAAAATTCPTGIDFGFSTVTTGDHESASLTNGWTELPYASCDGASPPYNAFTFHHYAVCTVAGSTPLAAPTAADCFSESDVATVGADKWVHRSNKAFATSVFACGNAGCTIYYGLGGRGSVTSGTNQDTVTTDPETWVLSGVESYADMDRVITDEFANAPATLFYPEGWTNAGYLGIWYSTGDGGPVIMHTIADSEGWQNFNGATFSTATPVAEGTTGPGGPFSNVSHQWVAAVDDGTEYIRMFFQGGDEEPFTVWSVDSTDDIGDDFALTCYSSPCEGAGLDGETCPYGGECDYDDDDATEHGLATGGARDGAELCSTDPASSTCNWLTSCAHGRCMLGYIEDPTVDFSVDNPMMLFSGKTDHTYGDAGLGDVFQAEWDTGTESWDTPNNGSSYAYDAIADYHDPGIVPLPNGEFKGYFKSNNAINTVASFQVCYYAYTGSAWEWGDCTPIELGFEGAGAQVPALPFCLNNIDTIVMIDENGPHEGAFFQAARETIYGGSPPAHSG